MTDSNVAEFVVAAVAGDRRQAVRLAMAQLDRGVSASTVIHDVLAPAQREVGERWHRSELTTADEHVATGVTHGVLEALASLAPEASPDMGPVVVACAETDWHALPAQMFAEDLRSRGVPVVFLGPSTPAADVASLLASRQASALGVSCNLPLSYIGTTRLVDSAHAQGVPVIAGGRALTPHRARVLGADAWHEGAHDAMETLETWRRQYPRVDRAPVVLDAGALTLDTMANELAERAHDTLEQALPVMASYTQHQRDHTRQDLAYIVRFVAAALLVDDTTVFTDFRSWLVQLLAARGVPASALVAGIRALESLVTDIDQRAGVLLAEEAGQMASSV